MKCLPLTVLLLIGSIGFAQTLQNKVLKGKVGNQVVELDFQTAVLTSTTHFQTGQKWHTLTLHANASFAAGAPIVAVSQLEPTEILDEQGKAVPRPRFGGGHFGHYPPTTASANPTQRYYHRVPEQSFAAYPPNSPMSKQMPSPNVRRIGVQLFVGSFAAPPKMLKQVKGTLYVLTQGNEQVKELPADIGDAYVDIGGGYKMMVTSVEKTSAPTMALPARPFTVSKAPGAKAPSAPPPRIPMIQVSARFRRPPNAKSSSPHSASGGVQLPILRVTLVDDLGEESRSEITGSLPYFSGPSDYEPEGRWRFRLASGRSAKRIRVRMIADVKEQSFPFQLDNVPVS